MPRDLLTQVFGVYVDICNLNMFEWLCGSVGVLHHPPKSLCSGSSQELHKAKFTAVFIQGHRRSDPTRRGGSPSTALGPQRCPVHAGLRKSFSRFVPLGFEAASVASITFLSGASEQERPSFSEAFYLISPCRKKWKGLSDQMSNMIRNLKSAAGSPMGHGATISACALDDTEQTLLSDDVGLVGLERR